MQNGEPLPQGPGPSKAGIAQPPSPRSSGLSGPVSGIRKQKSGIRQREELPVRLPATHLIPDF